MPQMKPINWLILYLLLNLILMFINIINYFFTSMNLNINKNFNPMKNKIWQW